jgi:IPT/TIG domain
MTEPTTEPTETPAPRGFPPPHIFSVTPIYGKAGAKIQITGQNLAPALETSFTVGSSTKTSPITEHFGGDTQVETSVPGVSTGNGKVRVISPGGPSNELDFVVLPG